MALKLLTEVLHDVTNCMKAQKRNSTRVSIATCKERSTRTWFDNDCERLRTIAMRALRHFRHVKTAEALESYKLAKAEYRELTKSKKNAYFERRSILLANAAGDKNAKTFWNMLRTERKPLTSDITPD